MTPTGAVTRPTADRVREAIFSMVLSGRYCDDLTSETRVLDAFAGCGALGLEALSRGAGHATFIERDGAAIAAIEENTARLGVGDRARVLRVDATRPPPARSQCDLVFLDPPYGEALVEIALTALRAADWLAAGALIVAEHEARMPAVALPEFEVVAQRTYGRTCVSLLHYGAGVL